MLSDAFFVGPPNPARRLSVGGVGRYEELATMTRSTSTATTTLSAYPPRKRRGGGKNKNNDDDNTNEEDDDPDYDPVLDEPKGRQGDGRNWIEKSSPIGIGKLVEGTPDVTTGETDKETDGNYDLGLNGVSFQTGELSSRMYDTLMTVAMKRFPAGTTSLPSEMEDVYKLYAMDITSKEAVKAALDQNGLEIALDGEEESNEDEGMWGDIDSVQLIDPKTGKVEDDEMYDTLDDAVEQGDWEPGQPFNFVVRNVPARLKEMDISDFLSNLDPDGNLRGEAKEKGITLPDEDVASLKDLGKECDRRVNVAPFEAEDAKTAYTGDGTKGYNIMSRSDLLRDSIGADGTENGSTLMHVMDALVSHGCLVVDVTDNGTKYSDALKLHKMWNVASNFFDNVDGDAEVASSLPGMQIAEGAGSPHAAVGFAQYGDGAMSFLETRIDRDSEDRSIVPQEAANILGSEGVASMVDAFDTMCDVGKDLVRVAIAAANMEYDAFLGQSEDDLENSDLPLISGLTFEEEDVAGVVGEGDYVTAAKLSSDAAALLADELIDDGKQNSANSEQGIINMSPHRLCRYQGVAKKDDDGKNKPASSNKETFGAHTDTSFLTLVPVADVSGLEVFDEAAEKWLRPELLARQKWEEQQHEQGKDPAAQTESITVFDDESGEERKVDLPWHCRYVVAMPGELLQIGTRNEVGAAIHRVISVLNGEARISAPALLRARSGMRLNLSKYFGNIETAGSLLKECDGMNMEDIHNALQPSSYRD